MGNVSLTPGKISFAEAGLARATTKLGLLTDLLAHPTTGLALGNVQLARVHVELAPAATRPARAKTGVGGRGAR